MQPLQKEHLVRLSLVHCRLRKSSRIVQCLSHSTGLSPCQHLSQIRCQCLSPILSQLRSLLPSLCRRLLMCQCQFPCPHLSSGPWKKWSLYPCHGRSPRRSQHQCRIQFQFHR